MDRQSVYRDQLPFESHVLRLQRYAYEALGLLALDIFGNPTAVSGLACVPTSPASMAVNVGPGRIYSLQTLEASVWGQNSGIGGIEADLNADHQILKQGLSRDTQTFAITAPGTPGRSQVYLIQAQYQTADAEIESTQFYNTAAPGSPITASVSPTRKDICALQLKAGVVAITGSQVCPAADSGWVPVWAITVAYGQTSITAPNIAAAPGAAFVTAAIQSGAWKNVSAAYTASAWDKLICDTSGGPFTLKLPVGPPQGSTIDVAGDFYTNNLTIDPQGATIDRVSGSLVMNTDGIGVTLIWSGSKWWLRP